MRLFPFWKPVSVFFLIAFFKQTDLPVFQGSPGNYDPLDAMRRDAYREIFLYIRRQLQLAIKETTEEEKND